MLSPRWRKVLRDLWGNKLRTVLVVLSIAVGIFAVGMISGSQDATMTALNTGWNATNPPSMIIYTDLFDEELLYTVRHMPGVKEADGRRSFGVRFKNPAQLGATGGATTAGTGLDAEKWRNLSLVVYPDYESIQVGKIWPQSGAWPPPEHQILVERASLDWMGVKVGDTILAEAPNGRQRKLRVAGVVHDPGQMQAGWIGQGIAYISRDTLDWFGASRDFDQLHVVAAGDNLTRSQLTQLAQQVRNKVEKSGRTIYYTYIPTPGKHPAGEAVEPILMVLGILGILALVLSGFLVVNTMQALLTQQVRQMGIMKAIGARNNQIMGIYLGMVIAFGRAGAARRSAAGRTRRARLHAVYGQPAELRRERAGRPASGVGDRDRHRPGRAGAGGALPDHHRSAYHAARGDERLWAGRRDAFVRLGGQEAALRTARAPTVLPADAAFAAQHVPAERPPRAHAGDVDPGRRDFHRRVQRARVGVQDARQHVQLRRLRRYRRRFAESIGPIRSNARR